VGTILVSLGAETHFRKARESLLHNDPGEAASEIRKGVADIKLESEQSTEKGEEILQGWIRELEKLADEVKKGAISSV
jgi:SpoVK/Ycf46/Vps4 family AAA+-type ATPase